MSETRYALFDNGENIYKDGRTFKSKPYTQSKLDDFRAWFHMCNQRCDIGIITVEVETLEEKYSKAIRALKGIHDEWDISNPECVIPKENSSFAAGSIISAISFYKNLTKDS